MPRTRVSLKKATFSYVPPKLPLTGEQSEQLLIKFINGSERAFEKLYECHYEELVAYFFRRVHDHERAEELAQDVLGRIAKYAHTYEAQNKFRLWLYTIARNLFKRESLNKGRKRFIPFSTLNPKWERAAIDTVDPTMNTEDLHRKNEEYDHVWEAIRMLPSYYRRVVILRFIDDKSYEEIAYRLNIPIGTVRSRVNRGRAILATTLRPLGYGSSS